MNSGAPLFATLRGKDHRVERGLVRELLQEDGLHDDLLWIVCHRFGGYPDLMKGKAISLW